MNVKITYSSITFGGLTSDGVGLHDEEIIVPIDESQTLLWIKQRCEKLVKEQVCYCNKRTKSATLTYPIKMEIKLED